MYQFLPANLGFRLSLSNYSLKFKIAAVKCETAAKPIANCREKIQVQLKCGIHLVCYVVKSGPKIINLAHPKIISFTYLYYALGQKDVCFNIKLGVRGLGVNHNILKNISLHLNYSLSIEG